MSRIEKEIKISDTMIRLYCRIKHQHKTTLCAECSQLADYARERLEKCRFGEEKPNCKDCPVHCYARTKREKIREVMRFSGPRMLFYHPKAAWYHFRNKK